MYYVYIYMYISMGYCGWLFEILHHQFGMVETLEIPWDVYHLSNGGSDVFHPP